MKKNSIILKGYHLKPGKMRYIGDALLSNLKGSDLSDLVRESLQNSLDAALSSDLNVEYNIFEHDFSDFKNLFEEKNIHLNKITSKRCQMMEIADYNTSGLTGDFDDDNSKISKLAAQFQRPDYDSNKGGSWGVGKSIYFLMGIGLVGFYSKTKSDEKLIFSFVERTESNSGDRFTENKQGISWWSSNVQSNSFDLIKKEKEISLILETLNVERFRDGETGTKILIPYFSYKKDLLLKNSILDWNSKIDDKLSYLVQKWYSSRLIKLSGEKKLQVNVNSKNVLSKEYPAFSLIRALRKKVDFLDRSKKYHFNIKDGYTLDSYLEWEEIDSFENTNTAYFSPLKSTKCGGIIGYLCLAKVNESFLKCDPHNSSTWAATQLGNETSLIDNRIFIGISRSSGIITQYFTEISESLNIDIKNSREYLIGCFVLNDKLQIKSQKNLSPKKLELGKYIRSCENERHTNWQDSTSRFFGYKDIGICDLIFANIRNTVKTSCARDEDNSSDVYSSLGSKMRDHLGSLLLPQGAGKSSRNKTLEPKEAKKLKKRKHTTISPINHVVFENIEFEKNIAKQVVVISAKDNATVKIFLRLSDEDGGSVTPDSWGSIPNSPEFPIKIDGIEILKVSKILKKKPVEIKNANIVLIEKTNEGFNLSINSNQKNVEITISIKFEIIDSSYKYELCIK